MCLIVPILPRAMRVHIRIHPGSAGERHPEDGPKGVVREGVVPREWS